jgi:NitT/TauT family transport system permease protein
MNTSRDNHSALETTDSVATLEIAPARASLAMSGLGASHFVSLATKLVSLLSFGLIWALAARWVDNLLLLPYPWTVAAKLYELVVKESFFMNAENTVRRVFIGFAISLVVGSAAGIAMGMRRKIEEFLDVYVLIGLTIPGLAWAVLSVMWFGLSEVAPVFAIVMVSAPMLAVNM